MNKALLQELKRKLMQDKQLHDVWTFFLDNFGDQDEFIALGKRADHPLVEAVLATVSKQLFPKDGAISGLLLTLISEERFIHGGFLMGPRVGGVIYFEDLQVGLIAVADIPPSIEVRFARFGGGPIRSKSSSKPSLN